MFRVYVSFVAIAILTCSTAGGADPRALSKAFRASAKEAIPAVVTIIAYGQNDAGDRSVDRQEEQPPDDANPPNDGGENSAGEGDEVSPQQPEEPGQSEDDADGENEDGEEAESEDDDSQAAPPAPDSLRPFRDLFPEQGSLGVPTGLGSGVVVSAEGVILTNHHVVQNASRILVRFQDGEERVAVDVRSDPASDVATIRVEADRPLTAAELGTADSLEIGDWVLAIGSPFQLEATVSAGIVSAKNREIRRIKRIALLQTDAAINPGNSGGPLVDLDGKVIGISTAIATRSGVYQGIGFAIPIDQAKWIADELIEHGEVRRASLGIQITNLNARIARQTGLSEGLGVLVVSVTKGSGADQAGLEPLDVILSVGGRRTRDARELQSVIERMPIGSSQTVEISREGKTLLREIELEPAG